MRVIKLGHGPQAQYSVTMSNMDHYNIGRAIDLARDYFYKYMAKEGLDPASEEAKVARRQWSTMRGLNVRFNEVEGDS